MTLALEIMTAAVLVAAASVEAIVRDFSYPLGLENLQKTTKTGLRGDAHYIQNGIQTRRRVNRVIIGRNVNTK